MYGMDMWMEFKACMLPCIVPSVIPFSFHLLISNANDEFVILARD